MPSNEDIAAAITSAEALAVTPAQMVALLDKAIAGSVAAGLPVVNLAIAGRSTQFSIADARELRAYYASLGDGGGMVVQGVEFR